ncbi:2Fe-2S iron-sulfur cluster-binding protein [Streptomyces sp. NPDC059104]|uniref:2Fe-2S iron-sulfur cluster-binding protein n=1 Tax=Streptomyces sp. NPDC059104 TaxID=3346729 RepID=UPI00368CDC1B
MSENENVSGTTGNAGGTGGAGNGWGWEPVPQGGEYDSEATAFVKLPQDMLDALDNGEPLAAPGHGYVPPPMIVPLGSASADPTATGTWTMPVQWPEAGADRAPAEPARGPIPASIPLPPSVAAAYAEPAGGVAGAGGGTGGEHDQGATAEWQFPDAVHQPDEPAATGQWTLPTVGEPQQGTGEFPAGGFAADGYAAEGFPSDGFTPDGSVGAADWSQAPATLPGGAAAPWAQPGVPAAGAGVAGGAFGAETLMSSGVLPGEGPGADAPGRGPRVLGGPGVGTPLPEGYAQPGPEPEGVLHAAPDIDAAHGPAQPPVEEQRPRPVEAEAETGPVGPPEQGLGQELGHGYGHGQEWEPEQERERERGFAEVAPAAVPEQAAAAGDQAAAGAADPDSDPHPDADPRPVAEAGAAGVPGEDTADSAVTPPDEGGGEGAPMREATYEEEGLPAVAHHEHPAASYVLRVNGADRPVTGAWIGESLLYVLRERLGLAGAKDGCSQGECGACAVQVDGRLVASCLVPAATAAGSEVRTVEGLATGGQLSDVQEALCRSGGVQCGFCVPGMAMTIHDLLEGNHAPSDLETRQALCGNLCRCSGYKGVVEAVREVVAEREATAAEAAAATAAGEPATAEPRIPHQAPPGEGGVHGGPGAYGAHGGHDTLGGGEALHGGHDTMGGGQIFPGVHDSLGGGQVFPGVHDSLGGGQVLQGGHDTMGGGQVFPGAHDTLGGGQVLHGGHDTLGGDQVFPGVHDTYGGGQGLPGLHDPQQHVGHDPHHVGHDSHQGGHDPHQVGQHVHGGHDTHGGNDIHGGHGAAGGGHDTFGGQDIQGIHGIHHNGGMA